MVNEIKSVNDFAVAIGNDATGLVVIDFFANWCGPCKQIAPFYAKLEEKYPNVGFYKLNSDNEATSSVIGVCEISTLPTFSFFYGGRYINKFIGANEVALENMIQQQLMKPVGIIPS